MHHRMEKDTPQTRLGLDVPVTWIQTLTAIKEEVEGRDSTLRDYTVADNNGELDDKEVKAVRQDSCATRRAWVESSRRRGAFIDIRARKASTDVTNDYDPDSDGKIGGECHTECYGTAAAPGSDGGATPSPSRSNFEALWFTSEERLRAEEERESGTAPSDEKEHKRDVWTYGEESPSPPASDDASATGRTYDDVTKLPPPHLRYVISPLPVGPPVLRCTAAPHHNHTFFCRRRRGIEAGSGRALREAVNRLFGA